MHQIRAHFAHLGFPLAGDVRYGPRKGPTRAGSRLFLHAAYVSASTSLTAVSPLKADLLEPLKDTPLVGSGTLGCLILSQVTQKMEMYALFG